MGSAVLQDYVIMKAFALGVMLPVFAAWCWILWNWIKRDD